MAEAPDDALFPPGEMPSSGVEEHRRQPIFFFLCRRGVEPRNEHLLIQAKRNIAC